ncbi:hypothetical protein JMJ35_000680 [Cladonia borealis]|uniref:Thioredoxin domain-containing protein n=1 Tax=Cladonia borealis TaxID=184061 RepID=A0AA39R9W2_9LECA|nr:hypothetical protein JMJ35_000680 [Cladonia borealis]
MLNSRHLIRNTTFFPRLTTTIPRHSFHTTTAKMVKVGDPIPSVELVEGSPGNKVNLANELKGKGLIIGVPAAFSPGCSTNHIPGYLNSEKLKDAGQVFVVSVNDAFVMKAWGATLDPSSKTSIRFLGDPSGQFTKDLDLTFESSAVFGNDRSKRYALVVEDGKVKSAHVEPDNTGVNESAAEKVLANL